MELLSGPPLYAAVGSLPTKEIVNLCATNDHLNANLCDNEDFWQYRYIQERGPPKVIPASWKRAYLLPNGNIDLYLRRTVGNIEAQDFTSISFLKPINDVCVIDSAFHPAEWAYVLTNDGRLHLVLLEQSPQIQSSYEGIAQIAGYGAHILIRTIDGNIYYDGTPGIPDDLIEPPFKVKFAALDSNGLVLVSENNELYHLPYEDRYLRVSDLRRYLSQSPQPLFTGVPDDITQIAFINVQTPAMGKTVYGFAIVAGGKLYAMTISRQNSLELIPTARPVVKIASGGEWILFDDGTIKTFDGKPTSIGVDDNGFTPGPIADFSTGPNGIIAADFNGAVWARKYTSPFKRIDLPIIANRVKYGTAIWNSNGAVIPTSFAHFSQLVNRGKIPEFKVPPQPGMNEPYVGTFTIPDIEGYEYEVTARYDPQTGQMTAP